MYGMVGPIIKIPNGKIMYSLDTSGGQSGGPISNIQTEGLTEELELCSKVVFEGKESSGVF